jgi:DNA-directed RNA polymerase subunit E'/Rpb7
MYRNHTHKVANRIVSLGEPDIHPIVCGKAKSPVEFGTKIDVSILDGIIDIERFSFYAFNESSDLAVTLDNNFSGTASIRTRSWWTHCIGRVRILVCARILESA